MTRRLEYFYDYVSPFSYLANSQLPVLAARTGAEVIYRPMLLGGVMKATGNQPPLAVPAKGKYMFIELERWAARYGIPLIMNSHFPINTVGVMRGALVAQELGQFPAYHEAMFRSMWCESGNLADEGVWREVMQKAGVDAEHIAKGTQEASIKDKLKANTTEAVERGAFGAPTMFVGDHLFFGNDRLDFVEEALTALPA